MILNGINGLEKAKPRSQNPPGFGPWGFDSPSRHQHYLQLNQAVGSIPPRQPPAYFHTQKSSVSLKGVQLAAVRDKRSATYRCWQTVSPIAQSTRRCVRLHHLQEYFSRMARTNAFAADWVSYSGCFLIHSTNTLAASFACKLSGALASTLGACAASLKSLFTLLASDSAVDGLC